MDAGSPAATAVLPQGSSSAPARQPAPAAASALTRTRVRAAWRRALSVRATSLPRTRVRAAWLFLLPMLLVMALTAVWPLGKTVWLGFTDSLLNPYTDSFIADGSSRAFPLRYGDDSGAALRVELSDTTLPADAWAVQDGGKTLVLDNAPAEGARVTATYLPRFVGL